jgi:hypothetical protein
MDAVFSLEGHPPLAKHKEEGVNLNPTTLVQKNGRNKDT